MVFHQPFLNQVAAHFPQADVLLGKPMPVVAAHNFYRQFAGGGFDPAQQLRWLLDTPERVTQYDELARAWGRTCRYASSSTWACTAVVCAVMNN